MYIHDFFQNFLKTFLIWLHGDLTGCTSRLTRLLFSQWPSHPSSPIPNPPPPAGNPKSPASLVRFRPARHLSGSRGASRSRTAIAVDRHNHSRRRRHRRPPTSAGPGTGGDPSISPFPGKEPLPSLTDCYWFLFFDDRSYSCEQSNPNIPFGSSWEPNPSISVRLRALFSTSRRIRFSKLHRVGWYQIVFSKTDRDSVFQISSVKEFRKYGLFRGTEFVVAAEKN